MFRYCEMSYTIADDLTPSEALGIGLCKSCNQSGDPISLQGTASQIKIEPVEDESSEMVEESIDTFTAPKLPKNKEVTTKAKAKGKGKAKAEPSGVPVKRKGRIRCEKCDERFQSRITLKAHMRRAHHAGYFKCHLCYMYKNRYADKLLEHMRQKHGEMVILRSFILNFYIIT